MKFFLCMNLIVIYTYIKIDPRAFSSDAWVSLCFLTEKRNEERKENTIPPTKNQTLTPMML